MKNVKILIQTVRNFLLCFDFLHNGHDYFRVCRHTAGSWSNYTVLPLIHIRAICFSRIISALLAFSSWADSYKMSLGPHWLQQQHAWSYNFEQLKVKQFREMKKCTEVMMMVRVEMKGVEMGALCSPLTPLSWSIWLLLNLFFQNLGIFSIVSSILSPTIVFSGSGTSSLVQTLWIAHAVESDSRQDKCGSSKLVCSIHMCNQSILSIYLPTFKNIMSYFFPLLFYPCFLQCIIFIPIGLTATCQSNDFQIPMISRSQ